MVIENLTNATAVGLGPISYISGVFNTLRVLVGGIFGLYVLLVVLRWIEYRAVKKFLKKMHYDLLQIGKKLGVKETSEKRKTGIKGIKEKIKKKR